MALGFGFLISKIFFFLFLRNLITSAQRERHNASYDSLEFFIARLQEKERTLAILTLTIQESYPSANEDILIGDLNELFSMVNDLRLTRDFVRTVKICERNTPPSPSCNELERLVQVNVTRSGLIGRLREEGKYL